MLRVFGRVGIRLGQGRLDLLVLGRQCCGIAFLIGKMGALLGVGQTPRRLGIDRAIHFQYAAADFCGGVLALIIRRALKSLW